jgi:hypothetical protein
MLYLSPLSSAFEQEQQAMDQLNQYFEKLDRRRPYAFPRWMYF